MNREEVISAIERRGVSGFPLFFINRDFNLSDIKAIGLDCDSAWGVDFQSVDETMGQVVLAPIGSYADFADFKRPNPYDNPGLNLIPEFTNKNKGLFTVAITGIMGFNWCCFLRGMEDFLMDLYIDKDFAINIADLVFNYMYGIIDAISYTDIDIIRIDDDAGTQNALLISPVLWREIFKPRYASLIDLAHSRGKKIWIHSCGYIDDIISDYIEIGLDVIELLQPDILGIENIGRKYGGKITFCCSVDHQRKALQGTREEIFEYVKRLYDNLGVYGGGFIGFIEYYESLGMTEDNYRHIRNAFFEYAK